MRLLKLLFAAALALTAAFAVAAGLVAVAIGALVALAFSLLPRRLRPRATVPSGPRRADRSAANEPAIDVTAREIPETNRPD